MEGWMYVTRIPAITRASKPLTPMSTKAELNAIVPRHAQWKAENYNHLHEQPTVFYAVMITLAVCGAGNTTTTTLAWMYMWVRILHSLVHATQNILMIRFGLFAMSSIILLGLTFQAVAVVF